MKVGTVYSSIIVDRDSCIYCGSEDPVTGNVVLEFKAWDREKGETGHNELFGPLKIQLQLDGDIKTEVDEDYVNRASRPEYRDERKLFQDTHLIYEGQIRLNTTEKQTIPFKVFFPKHAHPTPQQRKDGIQEENWDTLPPALNTEFSGAYGGGKGIVEYKLQANLELPGIDVDIATRGAPRPLQYRPILPQNIDFTSISAFEQAFTVTHESLIPPTEKPQGFRGKAKAMLKDVEPPTYAFDLLWNDVPDAVQPFQALNFRLSIRRNDSLTTATITPEIIIQECKLTLIGFCGVRVWPKYQEMKESAEMRDLEDCAVVDATISPDGPFTKENEFTKTATTQPLPYVPCSFAVERMSRYYKARISMKLKVAEREINAQRSFPITILPPLQQ